MLSIFAIVATAKKVFNRLSIGERMYMVTKGKEWIQVIPALRFKSASLSPLRPAKRKYFKEVSGLVPAECYGS